MAIPATTDDFKFPIHIEAGGTIPPLQLEGFQSEAVGKLKAHFSVGNYLGDLGYRPGLVVMPTGSGKTRTAVSWIMSDMIKQGYKILWLCHRTNLLEQTAKTMIESIGAAGLIPNKKLTLRCVSSKHSRSTTASFNTDDIVVFSILSLARQHDLIRYLLKGVKENLLLVVVDEAHHIPMNSYRKVLREIARHLPGFKLLGLTATPTRTSQSERDVLYKMFGDLNAVHQVSMGKLISHGFLARPIFERPKTEIDITTDVGEELLALMAKYRDIPETLLSKIAENGLRNKIIVERYMRDIDRYGQTLVFAVNRLHCHMLKQAFDEAFAQYARQSSKKYECDFIESGRTDNSEVIERFRRGQIRVLINIEIMTEGTDVPGIQTVFLTRPTASDTLLMQMVGRGMRGPAVDGGTSEVFIVDFQDNWDKFNFWLDPELVLRGELQESEDPGEEGAPPKPSVNLQPPVPPEIIADIIQVLRDPAAVSFRAIIPVGWYMVSLPSVADNAEKGVFNEIDSDTSAEERRIIVYENQIEAYDELKNSLEWFYGSEYPGFEQVIDRFFSDITDPLPGKRDLEVLVDFIRNEREMPPYFTFAEREQIDPHSLAKTVWDKKLSEPDKYEYLTKLFEESLLIQHIYGDPAELIRMVNQKMLEIGGVIKTPEPVVANPDLKILSPGPHHNLEVLYEEVVNERFSGDTVLRASMIKWTIRPVKSYWGQFRYGDRRMLINCLLDSPDVPADAIKFLIYHEQLHAQGLIWHNHVFRTAERKYPGYEEWDNFLDTLTEKYETPWQELHATVLARDSYRCLCCGRQQDWGVSLYADRIRKNKTALRPGVERYQTLCKTCRDINSARGINFRYSNRDIMIPRADFDIVQPALGELADNSLQRIINFYYGGNAFARLIQGGTRWKIELNHGINAELIINHKTKLLDYIRYELQSPNVNDISVISK
ncbi:MAG TPA: DEAD/DEAH box helicase [Syntrophomonadaceae bacterium]|nr:DEAD/DEAH box helicase [Syntrophomonadaceae bacterium]